MLSMAEADTNTNSTGTGSNGSLKNDDPDTIVENLYRKNIELLVKNKTLALLSKLYELSILTLKPKDLAVRITQTIQEDLSFELVSIYLLKTETNSLEPFAVSQSKRTKSVFEKQNIVLENLKITQVEKEDFFHKVIHLKLPNISKNLKEVWGKYIQASDLKIISSESNIKSTLLYSLNVENKVFGAIMIGLNRDYEDLSSFEHESIKSFVNLIALALEKASLYQELETANEELRESDRQKDDLLSIVSHQLAAPVTAIKWYLELFSDEDNSKITDGQKEQINTMQLVVMNLADLVSMILDVSRIQLGRMRIDKQDLDLMGLIEEILVVIQPKAEEKQQEFKLEAPKKLPVMQLDKPLMRMALENLLTNAVKYTPNKGKVTFAVKVEKDSLLLEIIDTGFGIPDSEKDKIFSKLYRASNVKDTIEGNGFGLYIVKGAIEAQGGQVWFESKENKGTTFFIKLPLVS